MHSKGTSVSNLLQQLQSKEAVLLMYLADELPPEDRVEVERMLAADPVLRADLDVLREAHGAFVAAMPALDRTSRPPVPQGVAVRHAVRAMRQWHAKRVARPSAPPAQTPLRFPWWAYPLAAAASVVFAFAVWWGHSDRRPPRSEYVHRSRAVSEGAFIPTPELDVAIGWEMGGPVEDADEARALVEPSDYNIFFLSFEDPEAGGAPGPAEPGAGDEEDDFSL